MYNVIEEAVEKLNREGYRPVVVCAPMEAGCVVVEEDGCLRITAEDGEFEVGYGHPARVVEVEA